ncbi:MgtC/SapB family protein [Belnapia moabensis]|uniref:MgtC/SapB family protein n=1 Tax=Belnapia moabensis TaxID=365533 RepID=UPI000A05AAAF
MIGAEREWRRHPGGLRSCAIVAAAACVFARIAVEHAGVILHHGMTVSGLSTATTF